MPNIDLKKMNYFNILKNEVEGISEILEPVGKEALQELSGTQFIVPVTLRPGKFTKAGIALLEKEQGIQKGVVPITQVFNMSMSNIEMKLGIAADRLYYKLTNIQRDIIDKTLESVEREIGILSENQKLDIKVSVMNKVGDNFKGMINARQRFQRAAKRVARDINFDFLKYVGNKAIVTAVERISVDKTHPVRTSFYKQAKVLYASEINRTRQMTELYALRALGYTTFKSVLSPWHYILMSKYKYIKRPEVCEEGAKRIYTFEEALENVFYHPNCLCGVAGISKEVIKEVEEPEIMLEPVYVETPQLEQETDDLTDLLRTREIEKNRELRKEMRFSSMIESERKRREERNAIARQRYAEDLTARRKIAHERYTNRSEEMVKAYAEWRKKRRRAPEVERIMAALEASRR